MYVVSIKGMVKQDQVFYYICEKDNQLALTDKFEQAMKFDNDLDAINWSKDNYTRLLQLLVDYRGPRIFNSSLAVRKFVFKTVQYINQDMFKEVNNVENNDACDESSDNGNLGEHELEGSSNEDAGETSGSDLQ